MFASEMSRSDQPVANDAFVCACRLSIAFAAAHHLPSAMLASRKAQSRRVHVSAANGLDDMLVPQ